MKNVRSSQLIISMNFFSKAQVLPCEYLSETTKKGLWFPFTFSRAKDSTENSPGLGFFFTGKSFFVKPRDRWF